MNRFLTLNFVNKPLSHELTDRWIYPRKANSFFTTYHPNFCEI